MAQKQETKLKEEMDYWVKDFEKKIQRTSDMELQVRDNKQNTDYNFELIQELQKQVKVLTKEVDKVKHYSFIALKSRPLKGLSED